MKRIVHFLVSLAIALGVLAGVGVGLRDRIHVNHHGHRAYAAAVEESLLGSPR